MPRRPYPPPVADSAPTGTGTPARWSSTSATSSVAEAVTETATVAPGACLATLVSDSWTTRRTA